MEILLGFVLGCVIGFPMFLGITRMCERRRARLRARRRQEWNGLY